MSERKASQIIKGSDYQKFAKKVSAKVNTAVMGIEYQDFQYNKKNIPKAAVFSSKDNSTADLDKLNTETNPRVKTTPRPNTSGETTEATEPDQQKKEVAKKAKAKSLVDQIINVKKGEDDKQIKVEGLGKKARFYYLVGGHEIPSPKRLQFYKDNDVSSEKYRQVKEQVIREYEAKLKTKADDKEKVQAAKESEIKK